MSEHYKPVTSDSLAAINRKNRMKYDADFKEADHPREGGKFSSKEGGGSNKRAAIEKGSTAHKELSAAVHRDRDAYAAYDSADRHDKERFGEEKKSAEANLNEVMKKHKANADDLEKLGLI